MNFDPTKMKQLLTLSDGELWAVLRSIAAANGVSLPATTPSPEEMKRFRAMLEGGHNLTPEQAKGIVDAYKAKNK